MPLLYKTIRKKLVIIRQMLRIINRVCSLEAMMRVVKAARAKANTG